MAHPHQLIADQIATHRRRHVHSSLEQEVFGPRFWSLLSIIVKAVGGRSSPQCSRLVVFASLGNDVALARSKSKARATTETRLLGEARPSHLDVHNPRTTTRPPPCPGPMSTYALQTRTMLQSVSHSPIRLLGQAPTRDQPKPQLPSKRKRDTICGLGVYDVPFRIRSYPGSSRDTPVLLKPVRVIRRSQLPLSFLDNAPDENLATNSLFSAQIQILEDSAIREIAQENPEVLIARIDAKRALYAIERVQTSIYSICRLVSWIKEKDVADLWDPTTSQDGHVSLARTSVGGGGEWWQHAAVDASHSEQPTKRARMMMMRPIPQSKEKEAPKVELVQVQIPPTPTTTTIDSTPIEYPQDPAPELPSPQEQLAALIQQYLDVIYMSKTSLAYFAKGPITRIRNAFTSAELDAPATHELVTSLRAMLLSSKASEKKYYEKLPAIIKAMPPGGFSDEEPAQGASKIKQSKKKVKLGRAGIYPSEELLIRKWWLAELPSCESMGAETLDQRLKRRIGDLRVRETLAQLILMLEIVALEALSSHQPSAEDEVISEENQAQAGSLAKPKKRKRKLDDINLQLDLLLDRLCIWHATEEMGILDFDTRPSVHDDEFGKTGANDRLHSFCVEVIIPFYMNRLPEQALMVNKKLGGPAHNSPPKRKALKQSAASRKSGDSKEPDSKRSRRSLARGATDSTGKTVARVPPSLNRSATDSALPSGIKREGSELPLSAIPFQRSPSKSARQSMSQIRHLQGRQIDLNRPSAAAEAKIKHKQRVEEDLQEAILALKKPNRGLAAGGYAADVEQRGLGQINKSRKPANAVRKVVKDVQVSATPRVGRRTKNMIEQTPDHRHHKPFVVNPTPRAPQSSVSCVPSSGAQPPQTTVPATGHRSAAGRGLVHPSIAETPSKAPHTKTFSSGAARRVIFTPSKPLHSSPAFRDPPSQVFETPVKSAGNLLLTDANSTPAFVFATSTKPGSVPFTDTVSNLHPPPREDVEHSIYDALGWNDDEDDML